MVLQSGKVAVWISVGAMPWSKHDLLLKKKYPRKLQVLFFSLLLKLLFFKKVLGKYFYVPSYPFVSGHIHRTNIRLYEIPYLAGSQVEVGCKKEMRDGWWWSGRNPLWVCMEQSSSAGNPALLPTRPSILCSTWQMTVPKVVQSGCEVRGLANTLSRQKWWRPPLNKHKVNVILAGLCLAFNQHGQLVWWSEQNQHLTSYIFAFHLFRILHFCVFCSLPPCSIYVEMFCALFFVHKS